MHICRPMSFRKIYLKLKNIFGASKFVVYANEKKKSLSLYDTYYRDCKLISVSSVKLSSNDMTQENIVLLFYSSHTCIAFPFYFLTFMGHGFFFW